MIGHIENYEIRHFYVNIDAVVKIVKKQGNCSIVIKTLIYHNQFLEIELTNEGFDEIIKNHPYIEIDGSKVSYDKMITNIESKIIEERERHIEEIKNLNNTLEILNQSKKENLSDKDIIKKTNSRYCKIEYEDR